MPEANGRPDPRQKPASGSGTELVLLQERSAGAFARVYLAEARSSDGITRMVAVKVLKEKWGDNPELLDRTRDEARLLARLRHRSILRVEALTSIEGRPALVMEFVDGVDLKQVVRSLAAEGNRVPARVVFQVAERIASALHAAWARPPLGDREPLKVVHRDIKPSNVMISCEGEVKVLDFGTARFSHELREARTSVLRFGSMKYMSPERKGGDRGDHSSDVYGLGLLLLEVLTAGELEALPAKREAHDEALHQLTLSIGDAGLPDARWTDTLRQCIARMCAYAPEQRLDAAQVGELFRAFADQAQGPSIETFAATEVTRITRQVYGDAGEGALSGSRIFIGPEGNPSDPANSGPRPPAPALDLVDPGAVESLRAPALGPAETAHLRPTPTPFGDAPTSIRPQHHAEPARNQLAGRPGSPPPARQPQAPETVHGAFNLPPPPPPAPMPAAPDPRRTEAPTVQAESIPQRPRPEPTYRPEPPPRPEPSYRGESPSRPESPARPESPPRPPPFEAPRATPPAAAPQPPRPMERPTERRAPAKTQAPSRSPWVLAVGAAAATFVILCGGGAVIAGIWYTKQGTGSVVVTAPNGDVPNPATPAVLAEEGGIQVKVATSDNRIRKLRLTNADGVEVAVAGPDKPGETNVPAGRYTISAKVSGRSEVSAEVLLEENAELTCTPIDKTGVRCTDTNIGLEVLLGA